MNIINSVTFTQKPTGEYGNVYEHAEVPTFTLAYYFEILLNPSHEYHQVMLAFAQEIEARARAERIAHNHKMMDRARANMSEDEWSMIVD